MKKIKNLFKKDAQAIGIQKELKTLQLEKLLELKKALDASDWTDNEFRSKFLNEINDNILKYQNEIDSLEKKLSLKERRELTNWHCTVKSFLNL
mgnify:CR=1 FL=1|jgi:hypothetical protein